MLRAEGHGQRDEVGRHLVPVRPGPHRRRSQLVQPQRVERPVLRPAGQLRLRKCIFLILVVCVF